MAHRKVFNALSFPSVPSPTSFYRATPC